MIATGTGLGERPPHLSVLYKEIMTALNPASPKRYIDGTLGAGGHAQGILDACAPQGRLLGLDVDESALDIAKTRLTRFGSRAILRKASYLQAKELAIENGWQAVDGIILDLGVSSMQIDQAQRGFSFQKEGTLDMRFDMSTGRTAADLVNTLDEDELADILWRYGEEHFSRRIASALVKARPINRTDELANLIRRTVGKRNEKIDPATRTFQALRIAVNEELTNLENALPDLISLLNPGGRLAVISFHSLEDRIVKTTFMKESRDCICPPEQIICTCNHKARIERLTIHPIKPTEEEIASNSRARSARLRVAQKLQLA
jgi:16S rRNA (cytosine1402-N4)-methyltransferase